MKRLVSIFVVISIMLGILPVMASESDPSPKLLYNAFFDELGEQDPITYTLRTLGKDENNRFAMKQGFMNMVSEGNGNPGFEFRTGKKVRNMVIHLNMRIDEIKSDVVLWISDYDDSLGRLLLFTTQGTVKAADGSVLKDAGNFDKNSWMSVDLVIESGKYSLLLNGKKVQEGLSLPSRSNENNPVIWEKNIKSVRLDTLNKTNSCTSADFKEVVAYEGTELFSVESLKTAAKPVENNDEDLSEDEEVAEDATEIYSNCNFNDAEANSTNTGIGGDKKTNLVYVDEFPSEENKSVRLESLTSDTFNVLTSFDSAMKKSFVWDFRVYFDDVMSKATLTMRDPKPIFVDAIQFLPGGQIRDANSNTIGKYNAKTWYRAQLVVDVAEKKYSFYLDGKELVNNGTFNSSVTSVGLIRFHVYPPADGGSVIHIDDWRVYEGNVFLDDAYLEKKGSVSGGSHYTDHDKMESIFNNKLAFSPAGPWFYTGKERVMYDSESRAVKALDEEGKVLVPLRSVIEKLGGQISWDDGNVTALYNNKQLSVAENSNEYVYDGNAGTADAAAKTVNDKLYVSLNIVAKLLGCSVTKHSSGLYILTKEDDKVSLDNRDKYIGEMYRYLLYDHPSEQDVMEKLALRYPNNEHPRIMVEPGDFERIGSQVQTDSVMKGWYDSLQKSADSLIGAASIVYTPAKGTDLLESSRTMLSRAKTLGLMYNLTGDKKYKDELWKNLENVCSFPDWYPTHFLDVGEMSMAVSIGYDWVYNDWSKGQRKILEDALISKGLEVTLHQYETDNQTGYWTVTNNNWNVVCNGGAAVAALAIGDKDPELTGKIVHYALWGLESMMKEYAPDGGWSEGITYWQYATSYFTQLMSSLNTALGSDFGFMDSPGVDKTGAFVIQGTGPKGIFNYHDAGSAFYGSPEILWMSSRLNKPELTKNNLYNRDIYNLGGGAAELIWYDPNMNVQDENAKLPTDAVFHGTEIAFMRSTFGDPNGTYVGLHGGLNNANHGNLDNGTFIMDSIGERWFLDLGGDSYSLPEYFGAKRWNYYRMRAEGQNTLVINPSVGPDQIPTATGKIVDLYSKPQGAYSVLDMTPAYTDAEDIKRGMMLSEDRSVVTVRDEIKLKKSSELYWFAHTKADIKLSDDGKSALLSIGNKQLYAQLLSDMDAKFSVMDAKPLPTSPQYSGQNANSGIKKLSIHLNGVKEGYIQVSFMPILIYGQQPNAALLPEVIPISKWKDYIPDGELVPFGVDSISADGKQIDGFDSSNLVYKIKYPFGTTTVPNITALASDRCKVDIIQSETMPGSAKVIVTDKENSKRQKTYLIEFVVLPQIGKKPEGSVEVTPTAVTASETPQAENTPQNTLDGDLSTRWSAFGVQWIDYDLGTSYELTNIELAWMNGDKRTYPFEIYLSEDGVNYQNVLRSESSKTTNDLEMHQLPQTKARYVRVKCFGNNENEWCSLTETKIYAKE